MALHGGDVWGHIAPMFHLVDAFAIYAVTYVGGRHVTMPAFEPKAALALIGELWFRKAGAEQSRHCNGEQSHSIYAPQSHKG